jgi:hypothetical protein
VTPGPCPLRTTHLLSWIDVPAALIRNVPLPRLINFPLGQVVTEHAAMEELIAAVSSLPLGVRVDPHCLVLGGIPPTDSKPAIFQLAVASRPGVRRPEPPTDPLRVEVSAPRPGGGPLKASVDSHAVIMAIVTISPALRKIRTPKHGFDD